MADRVSVDEGSRLRALVKGLDLTPLLKRMGILMVGRVQSAFDRQGRTTAWPARQVPNVAGIVADLAAGGSVKPRRFEPRPAGMDTGQLRASISFAVNGADSVDVGSQLSYADRVQNGGVSEQPITPEVRRGLAKFLRERGDKSLRKRLGFLFGIPVLRTNVQPRPFLEVTREDVQDLEELAREFVSEAGAA